MAVPGGFHSVFFFFFILFFFFLSWVETSEFEFSMQYTLLYVGE